MSWWRQNWRWFLFLVVALIGFILVVVLYALYQRKKAIQLRAQLALADASVKVAGIEADMKARDKELVEDVIQAKKLEKEITALKRGAIEVVQATEGMSDAAIADKFRDLGY